MKLMIIEKKAHVREMVRNFLNLPGITVCECANGNEAVACAREFKPDWITVDVNQIGADGIQSADALREAHPAAQVVIMTGYNDTNFYKLCNSVGRSALFEKKVANEDRPAPASEGKTKFRRRTPAVESAPEESFAGMDFAPSPA